MAAAVTWTIVPWHLHGRAWSVSGQIGHRQPLATFVTASLELVEPMYEWFLQAWDKVAKDKSGEAVSPTCDNLSEKVQKNRRAWWMKPEYKSTHPKTREDFLALQHAADYVSPVARLDREKTSSSRNIAMAALVRDACAAFTCNVRMVDALIEQASSLEFRVYILEDGSSDCTMKLMDLDFYRFSVLRKNGLIAIKEVVLVAKIRNSQL